MSKLVINRPWLPNPEPTKKIQKSTPAASEMKHAKPEPSITKAEFIARIRHIAWYTYQIGAGHPFDIRPHQAQFESLKQEIQHSLDNPELLTPKEKHDNRVKIQESQGWTYGPVKDLKKKTDPGLIPYEQLPEDDRIRAEMVPAVQKYAEDLWSKLYEQK